MGRNTATCGNYSEMRQNEVELMPGGEMGTVRENKYCEILVIVWGYMGAYDIILSIFGN